MKSLLLIATVLIATQARAGGFIVSGGFDDRAIKVSFVSRGAGVDEAAKDKLLDVVKEGLARERISAVTSTKESFEGDITYCVEFVNSGVMSQYYDPVNDIVKDGQDVSGITAPNCK